MENTTRQRPHIMELIDNAPWREAVTYRKTWPHEYVVVKKDGQEELLAAFCERIERGEGVECRFLRIPTMPTTDSGKPIVDSGPCRSPWRSGGP